MSAFLKLQVSQLIRYKRTHTSMWKEICFVNKEMNKNIVPGACVIQQAEGCRRPRPSVAGQVPIWTLCPLHTTQAEHPAHTAHFPRDKGGTFTHTEKPWSPSISERLESMLKPCTKGTHSDTCTTIAGTWEDLQTQPPLSGAVGRPPRSSFGPSHRTPG